MLTRAQSVLFSAVAISGGWLFTSSPAHAELETCGGIFVSGDASCGYRPKEECMTECMTVAVEESCVAEVYNSCETSCTTTASTECESTCTTSCVNDCTTTTTENPPSCMDLCLQDCEADGGGSCGSATHKGPCGRCQKFNCNKRCEAKCGDEPEPTRVTTVTECMPTCSKACMASCTAKVNTQCQVDCQEKTYTSCEQKMIQRCETQCEDKGGAIFCDGQFVNAADVHDCADELKAKVKIDIDIDAALEEAGKDVGKAASDVGKEVDEHVDVDAKCAVTNVGASSNRAAFSLLALPVGLAIWRTRRRAKQQR